MAEPPAGLESARIDADRRYNDSLSALDRAIVELTGQPTAPCAELGGLMTTLIVFLQQMTAFVETKDREIEGRMIRRFEALAPYLDSLAELRTQMTVLHRTTQLLTRQLAESAPPASDVRAPDE